MLITALFIVSVWFLISSACFVSVIILDKKVNKINKKYGGPPRY